jgi:NADH-quinone oxidoreductase subunit L
MLTNKFGDYLLSFGLVIVFAQLYTTDISIINNIYGYYNTAINNNLISILAIAFIIASMAKSAQLGLHLWLIHAMLGNT